MAEFQNDQKPDYQNRLESLKNSIYMRTRSEMKVPMEWIEEYNGLLRLLETDINIQKEKDFQEQVDLISKYYDTALLVEQPESFLSLMDHVIVRNRIYKALKSFCDGTYSEDPENWNFTSVEAGEPKKLLEVLKNSLLKNEQERLS